MPDRKVTELWKEVQKIKASQQDLSPEERDDDFVIYQKVLNQAIKKETRRRKRLYKAGLALLRKANF